MVAVEISVEVPSGEFVNVTREVERVVEESGISDGLCTVIGLGSTCGVVLNEDEPSLIDDMKTLLERLVPEDGWRHPENAHSHLRAMILGSSVSLPVVDGKLKRGTWQEILVYNGDTRKRTRWISVVVTPC